jgi:cyclopropane-fatty-acyl-phospholipid synthase
MAVQRSRSVFPAPVLPSAASVSRAVLAEVFGPPGERSFQVRFWDGSLEGPSRATPFTLVLKRPGALRRMLLPPTELRVGEAYLRDDFDVEGDLESAAAIMGDISRLQGPGALARVLPRLLLLPLDLPPPSPTTQAAGPGARKHTQETDARVVRYHYDVGNDFYALWLDERMVYSCAYFRSGGETLDEAQEAKLELICRKLRLEAGEQVLDIGCGWGGFLIHAAGRYGVNGLGITLSEAQAQLARERVAAAGLSDRVRIEVRDYRDLPGDARFDKIVSVGMVEHVGRVNLPTYFARAHRLLKPGGLFLNHGIVHPRPDPVRNPIHAALLRATWPHTSFIERYVFPGGELVTPGAILHDAEVAGFETRDVESLREHYALTLRHWVRRLETRHDEATALVGEATYRVWRLYMAGMARAFATGFNGVIQALLAKPRADGRVALPLTREDVYQTRGASLDWLQSGVPQEIE